MKKHLTEGELRASLDGELDESLLTPSGSLRRMSARPESTETETSSRCESAVVFGSGDGTRSIRPFCLEPFY